MIVQVFSPKRVDFRFKAQTFIPRNHSGFSLHLYKDEAECV
jgi:hypothetical protein